MQIKVVGEAVLHIATSRANKPLCPVLYSILDLEQPCGIPVESLQLRPLPD